MPRKDPYNALRDWLGQARRTTSDPVVQELANYTLGALQDARSAHRDEIYGRECRDLDECLGYLTQLLNNAPELRGDGYLAGTHVTALFLPIYMQAQTKRMLECERQAIRMLRGDGQPSVGA